MCDSERLRIEYEQPDIADGWEILAEGEGHHNYGYGSRDTLMYLRRDGVLYCHEASCCSCNGVEGSFDPVETNIETIKRDLAHHEGVGNIFPDPEKARVCRDALAKCT